MVKLNTITQHLIQIKNRIVKHVNDNVKIILSANVYVRISSI